MNLWERYFLAGRQAGCPKDQMERFGQAEVILQQRQLVASAAARQCDAADGPTSVGYGGARGGGKSHWLLAQMGADDCQRVPGLKCLLLRKVGKANLEHFEDLRRRLYGRLAHEFSAFRGVLTFANGSRIIAGHFQSEKDIDAYLGLEYDVIGIEEATTLSSRKHQDITTCCRTSKPNWRPRIYSTTNPGGVGHGWYRQKFIVPFQEQRERETRFIPARVSDNQWNNPEWQQEVLADGPRAARQGNERAKWKLMETRVPLRLGKALPLIPFVFHGPNHARPEVEKLPLADIITVNLDHYRLDADYKHGVHFTALPTAWVSGFDKSSTLRIGSSTAWVTETPGATAGYLEFTGQGLETFERAMDRDERLLAVLGSRLLEGQKKVGETAQAIELRQSGENSILGNIAGNVSASLTQVLRWAYWWNSTEASPDEVTTELVSLELNSDFSTKGLSSLEIQAIVAAWQAGAISRDTMLDLFRRGEVLPEGRTNEEEERLIGVAKDEVVASPGAGRPEGRVIG